MATYIPQDKIGLTPGTGDWYYRALITLMFPAIRWTDEPESPPSQGGNEDKA